MDMAKMMILGSKSWKLGKHSNEKNLSIYLSIIYLYLSSFLPHPHPSSLSLSLSLPLSHP